MHGFCSVAYRAHRRSGAYMRGCPAASPRSGTRTSAPEHAFLMLKLNFHPAVASLLLLGPAGCDHWATIPESAGFGPGPTLPLPHPTLIPTVQIAPAKGWPSGATPVATAGLAVHPYAAGLDHPRWLHVLPNGDVHHTRAEAGADTEQFDGKTSE